MLWKPLLVCTLLLTLLEPLLTLPFTHSGMPNTGPAVGSSEEDQLINLGELSYSGPAYLPRGAAGLSYSSLLRGEVNGEGLRGAGPFPPSPAVEALLAKASMDPLGRFLGLRKQYRKRGSNTECFWKYCV